MLDTALLFGTATIAVHAGLSIFGVSWLARQVVRGEARDPRVWLTALALLARAPWRPVMANWYSFTAASDGGLLNTARAAVGVQRLAERIPFAPSGFTVAVAWSFVSGVALAPLVVTLAMDLGLPRPWIAGVLAALWPALIRSATSDAQASVIATQWLVGALLWRRGLDEAESSRFLRILSMSLGAALLAGLPTLRIEAAPAMLAAFVLFPPRRSSWGAWCVAAAVAACGALFGATSDARLHQIHISPGNWVLLPLALALGLSKTWPVSALTLLLFACAWRERAQRASMIRLTLAIHAGGLSVLVSGRLPSDELTTRYFFFLAVPWLLVIATGAQWIMDRVREQPRRQWALGVLCAAALAGETWFTLRPDAQYVFRREAWFLRDHVTELARFERVCMLDPSTNHTWPGVHQDFDVGLTPRNHDESRYLGLPVKLLHATALENAACDAYYVSPVCALAPEQHNSSIAADVARIHLECQAWERNLTGPPVLEQRTPAIAPDAAFAGPEVSLRVYAMPTRPGSR
ncbi:Hypothetical protein A7982_08986 [Minicystis rosea]|nr:Hypothetical protein A7982_08986 [Minicystis rosea]